MARWAWRSAPAAVCSSPTTPARYPLRLADTRYNTDQIRFIHQIIDHLTRNGIMDPSLLYEQPFTDYTPLGLDGLFPEPAAADIVHILTLINQNAAWPTSITRSPS